MLACHKTGKSGSLRLKPHFTISTFMGLNILFWNCQGIRPKRKELELYVKENEIDIVALNETFLNKNNKKRSHTQLDSRKQVIAFQDRVITINVKEAQHLTFKIPGYDTIRNDR